MISDFEVRSKSNKIFRNRNPFEEYSVRIYDIDSYFHERYGGKMQFDNNNCEYISFKIDIYFSDYFLAVEIDNRTADRDIIFELRRQEALEEELDCKLIRITAGIDLEYEISYIQKFIDEFKDNKIKELKDENRNLMVKNAFN